MVSTLSLLRWLPIAELELGRRKAVSKKNHKLHRAIESAKERRLDQLVSTLARAGAILQEQGAEVYIVLPLPMAKAIGALAVKREQQCRDN
jgi:hypothetical protein